MKILTRQEGANVAAKNWSEQYLEGNYLQGVVLSAKSLSEKKKIWEDLVKLGDSPDPDEVDTIIGNKSWTYIPKCGECGGRFSEIIEVGGKARYNNLTAYLCKDCLEKVLEMFNEPIKSLSRAEVKHCGSCPFQCSGYCGLASLSGEGLYVKNEWREETLSRKCPLRGSDHNFYVSVEKEDALR